MSTTLDLRELAKSFRDQAQRLEKAADALDPPERKSRKKQGRRKNPTTPSEQPPFVPSFEGESDSDDGA